MSIFSFLVLQKANSFLNHVLEKNSSVMKLIVCSVEKFFCGTASSQNSNTETYYWLWKLDI